MELKVEGIIRHETTQPYKVELTRGQKGSYAWTITYHGDCPNETIENIKYVDKALREEFLPPVAPPEET